jgi:hypothetical protein
MKQFAVIRASPPYAADPTRVKIVMLDSNVCVEIILGRGSPLRGSGSV